MTKEKFRELCEHVLIPRLESSLHRQLVDLHETLDLVARELARIGDRMDRVAMHLNKRSGHASDG